jgi:Fur family peroxide stress response transcriptional regulator
VTVTVDEIERRLGGFRAACRQAGVKLTQQRLEIFREVAGSLDHPDAEMVFRAVQPRLPTVSLDTVYRTLWLLSDLGLINPLGPRRESVRFDANLGQHHHYVCLRCGMTRDFDSAELELNAFRIPRSVKELGCIVDTHVEVRGVCHRCAREQAEESEKKTPKPRGKERSRP